MKSLFTSLNNLFKTDATIDNIIRIIQANKRLLPPKYKDFDIVDNELVYVPLGLIVVRNENKKEFLQDVYKNNINMIGRGVDSIYKYIQSQYVNVTRNDIYELVKNEPNHQLLLPKTAVKAKPIVEKACNMRWQIDLIDMSYIAKQNNHINYIFNCVDVFSRYCWIRGLKRKDAVSTQKALESIFDEANIKPKMIQTDNGTEFMSTFDDYIKEQGIVHILNSTYTPTQNAIVERSNKDIRKIINSFLVTNNTKRYIDNIDQVQTAKNSAYISTIKAIPKEIWRPDTTITTQRILPKTMLKPENKTELVRYEMTKVAKERMDVYKRKDDYKKDDYVLLKMSTIFSNMRQMIKAGESKKLAVHFAPILFRIEKVIQSRKPNTRNKYILMNAETGNIVCDAEGKQKHMTANDIAHATNNNNFEISLMDALELNGIKEIPKYDLKYD